jgi:LPS sulfotransferase NodH
VVLVAVAQVLLLEEVLGELVNQEIHHQHLHLKVAMEEMVLVLLQMQDVVQQAVAVAVLVQMDLVHLKTIADQAGQEHLNTQHGDRQLD